MERIVYRITLDSHKTGIQRTLQGFETADNMARTIAVNITASGDTYEIPLDNVVAMMYVTTPNASEPSINECRIEDNTIYYDVLPIVEEGITEMKIKLIETSVDGAKRVLIAPKFVVEVTESGTEDDSAEQTTTFTALENAIAKAHGVYDQRLLNIEIGPDCVFRAIYADGTVYENHYLHEALYNGNALLSESWAKGGTGIREDEETNNSKYFSNVSKSSSIEASASADMVRGLVDMAKLYSTYTSFDTNFETGELEYISASHNFDVNEETGELEVEGELFDPTDVLEKVADDYLDEKTQEISKNTEDIDSVEKEVANLKSDFTKHTHTANDVGAIPNPSGLLDTSVVVGGGVTYAGFIANASGDKRQSVLQLITSPEDISNIVRVGVRSADGSIENYYRLYGEHNAFSTFLPLSGGMLSGAELYLANGYSRWLADVGVFQIEARNANNTHENMRVFRVDASNNATLANALRFKDRISHNETEYKIYGEHNKPSGTYTGNGSATERRIKVGGIGSMVHVTSNMGYSLLVHSSGGITQGTWDGASVGMFTNQKMFLDTNTMELVIRSNADNFNASGGTYTWRLL